MKRLASILVLFAVCFTVAQVYLYNPTNSPGLSGQVLLSTGIPGYYYWGFETNAASSNATVISASASIDVSTNGFNYSPRWSAAATNWIYLLMGQATNNDTAVSNGMFNVFNDGTNKSYAYSRTIGGLATNEVTRQLTSSNLTHQGDVFNNAGQLAQLDGSGLLSSAMFPTVNGNVGTFGDAAHSVTATVDAKGRITAISQSAITGAGGGGGFPLTNDANFNVFGGTNVTHIKGTNGSDFQFAGTGLTYSNNNGTVTMDSGGVKATNTATGASWNSPTNGPTDGFVQIATGTTGDSKWGSPPGGPPSGSAGGILSGSYPNPGFSTFSSATLGAAISDKNGGAQALFTTGDAGQLINLNFTALTNEPANTFIGNPTGSSAAAQAFGWDSTLTISGGKLSVVGGGGGGGTATNSVSTNVLANTKITSVYNIWSVWGTNVPLTLPPASTNKNIMFTFIVANTNANSTASCIVTNFNGVDLVAGSLAQSLSINGNLTVVSDGTNWIGGNMLAAILAGNNSWTGSNYFSKVTVGTLNAQATANSSLTVTNLGQTTNIVWDLGATNYTEAITAEITNSTQVLITNWMAACCSFMRIPGPTNASNYALNIIVQTGATAYWYSDVPLLVNSNKVLLVSISAPATNKFDLTGVESR